MKDVGPDLRQLIDSARAGDTPTAADRERVRSALAAALVSSGGPAAPAAGPGARGWLARIGLAVLLGGALIGGGWWFVSRGTRDWRGDGKQQVVAMPEPEADVLPVAVADAEPGPEPESEPEPEPEPKAEPARRAHPVRPVAKETGNLAEEARLLREAEIARRAGDVARATSLLDEHARRFPRGALAIERDAARVLVLCDAGRATDARRLAARFLRRHPRSPLADRVRSACEAIP